MRENDIYCEYNDGIYLEDIESMLLFDYEYNLLDAEI